MRSALEWPVPATLARTHTAFARNGIWPSLDAVVSYDRFGLAGSANPAGPTTGLPSNLDGTFDRSFKWSIAGLPVLQLATVSLTFTPRFAAARSASSIAR